MNPQQLRLYAVTDRSWLKPGETLAEVVETLLKAGVTCVQLREKEAEDAFILQEARELKALCHRYGVPFLVNDRLTWRRRWVQMASTWARRTLA